MSQAVKSQGDGLLRALVLSSLLLFGIFAGCQSLYTGAVTLTKVVDSAAKEYAHAYNDGLVPADVAAKVAVAHLEYRKAAGVAEASLIAYKAGNDSGGYK